MTMKSKIFDVLILGGGPAGLSTALGLCRVRRTAVVVSNGSFRNDGIHEMHAVLGHDKWNPADFRRESRKQVEAYGDGVQFAEGDVVRVLKKKFEDDYEGFEAEGRGGETWRGKKLVLAMGSKDVFPDIPGYAENWPDNIFQCLFCDGLERSHLPFGSIGFQSSAMMNHIMMMRHLGGDDHADITVFSNGPLAEDPDLQEAAKAISSVGIRFETGKIVKLERSPGPDGGIDVYLEDGSMAHMGFMVDKPPTVPVGEKMLVEGLGVELGKDMLGSFIKRTEPFGATNVTGCLVAGDAGSNMKHVTVSVAQGAAAAAGAQMQLATEEAERALAAYRTQNSQTT